MIQVPLLLGLGAASAGYLARRALRDTRLEWRRAPQGTSTYRGGRYCGPGWGFTRQQVEDGTIASLPAALDAIDEACKHHDQCYADHDWFKRECNVRLASELAAIVRSPASTPQQRVDAAVMAAVFAFEAERVDPWLRPLYRGTKLALEALFQGAATMHQAMEREIYRLYGVPH